MIDIYDGNNVMLRAMMKPMLGAARPMSLRMRYEQCCAQPEGTQIWCWDGFGHNERRRELYPPYKMNRSPMAEDMFSQIKLWRECLRSSPAAQVEIEGWEADDVVSSLVRLSVARGIPVRVHTNDMDYAQLGHLPGVTLNGVNDKGVPGRWVALYKAMVGDTSDNIAGIPNFGHKRWEAMVAHWALVERAIVQGHPAAFIGLPFTKGIAAWLAVQENIDTLRAMLTVTHFIDVPQDELDGGIIFGQMDRQAAHQLLGRYFL